MPGICELKDLLNDAYWLAATVRGVLCHFQLQRHGADRKRDSVDCAVVRSALWGKREYLVAYLKLKLSPELAKRVLKEAEGVDAVEQLRNAFEAKCTAVERRRRPS